MYKITIEKSNQKILENKSCTRKCASHQESGRYWGYGEVGVCLCCQRENKVIRTPGKLKMNTL